MFVFSEVRNSNVRSLTLRPLALRLRRRFACGIRHELVRCRCSSLSLEWARDSRYVPDCRWYPVCTRFASCVESVWVAPTQELLGGESRFIDAGATDDELAFANEMSSAKVRRSNRGFESIPPLPTRPAPGVKNKSRDSFASREPRLEPCVRANASVSAPRRPLVQTESRRSSRATPPDPIAIIAHIEQLTLVISVCKPEHSATDLADFAGQHLHRR